MSSPTNGGSEVRGHDRQRAWTSALLDYLTEVFMLLAPQDSASMRLKRRLLLWRGSRIGVRCKIWRDVWIDDYRGLSVGDEVTIGKSVMLLCGGHIQLGDRVMIGHGSKLVSAGHQIPDSRDEPMRWSGATKAPIRIADDVWIGAGAIILAGVDIGQGAVVAAGAVVSRSVPAYAVVAGVPAKVLRERSG